jgi:hypothetical protein
VVRNKSIEGIGLSTDRHRWNVPDQCQIGRLSVEGARMVAVAMGHGVEDRPRLAARRFAGETRERRCRCRPIRTEAGRSGERTIRFAARRHASVASAPVFPPGARAAALTSGARRAKGAGVIRRWIEITSRLTLLCVIAGRRPATHDFAATGSPRR